MKGTSNRDAAVWHAETIERAAKSIQDALNEESVRGAGSCIRSALDYMQLIAEHLEGLDFEYNTFVRANQPEKPVAKEEE